MKTKQFLSQILEQLKSINKHLSELKSDLSTLQFFIKDGNKDKYIITDVASASEIAQALKVVHDLALYQSDEDIGKFHKDQLSIVNMIMQDLQTLHLAVS